MNKSHKTLLRIISLALVVLTIAPNATQTMAHTPGQLASIPATTQPQAAVFFAVPRHESYSPNEVYRYRVAGPNDQAILEKTITSPDFNSIYGVSFNPNGEMYITNVSPSYQNGSIARILDPVNNATPNGQITNPNFTSPVGLVIRGNLMYVAQDASGNVLVFSINPDGSANLINTITANLSPGYPRGVTINPAGTQLLVTQCCGINQVVRYAIDGNGGATFMDQITGNGLSNPHDMVFSPWGELFVANAGGNSVSRFTFDQGGNPVAHGQITGNGLNVPVGLAFSPWGELFVGSHYAPLISRWIFNNDASHTEVANSNFSVPYDLSDILFYPGLGVPGNDMTPPVITPTVSPPPNTAGWNDTNVTVSWEVQDPETGVTSSSGCATTLLSADTAGTTLTCVATNGAGLSNSVSIVVKIDKTPPSIVCSVSPNTLWPPNHELVSVKATVTVTDALSGQDGFILVSATSNEPNNNNDIQGFVIGTASTSGLLRAERAGSDTGRVYTLTYQGADQAGNSATCTATVTVPHDQGH